MDVSEYHRVLGTTPDDSEEYVTSRYKELSLVWHPDKCGKHDVCTESRKQLYNERQREINEAYAALRADLRKRGGRGARKGGAAEPFQFSDYFSKERVIETSSLIVGIALLVLLGLAIKAMFSKLWRFLSYFSSAFGHLLVLMVAIGVNEKWGASEYGALVAAASWPVYLWVLLWAVSAVWSAVAPVLRFLGGYTVFCLLSAVGVFLLYNPIVLIFPKLASICFLLALLSTRRLGVGSAVVLCSACGMYIYNSSDDYLPGGMFVPFSQLTEEFIVLSVLRVIFVFGYVGGSIPVQNAGQSLQACLQPNACSGAQIGTLLKFITDHVKEKWGGPLFVLVYFIPVIVIAFPLVKLVSTVLGRIGVLFSPLGGSDVDTPQDINAVPDVTPSRSAPVYSKEQEEDMEDVLMAAFPELTRRDARSHLRGRLWDVDAATAFLSSAAGKASRAALSRMHKHGGGAPDVIDLSGSSGNSSCRSKAPSRGHRLPPGALEEYPPVMATSRTVLPRPTRASAVNASAGAEKMGNDRATLEL